MSDKKIIFISCGQQSDEEKQLGAQIQDLVQKLTPFEPYFAEYQTSLEGLTKHIFSALSECVGFITILHPRGTVDPPGDRIRASVWVEQEIAIAAFVQEVLGRKIHVLALVQKDVALEGVRKQLLLNPKQFTKNEEALEYIQRVLPAWTFPKDPLAGLDLSVDYETKEVGVNHHDYRLLVRLLNRGTEIVDKYYVDLEFPSALLPIPKRTYVHIVEKRCTDTHSFFRAPLEAQMEPIYPGDIKLVLGLDYFVDDKVFHSKELFNQRIRATLYAKGSELKTIEDPVSQYQAF